MIELLVDFHTVIHKQKRKIKELMGAPTCPSYTSERYKIAGTSQLTTMMDDLNLILGLMTIDDYDNIEDGVKSISAKLNTGTDNISTKLNQIFAALGDDTDGMINVLSNIASSLSNNQGTIINLITGIKTSVGGTASLEQNTNSASTALGSFTGYTSITEKIGAVQSSLGDTTKSVSELLTFVKSKLNTTNGTVLYLISSIQSDLGTSSDISTAISTLSNNLGVLGSAQTLTEKIQAVNDALNTSGNAGDNLGSINTKLGTFTGATTILDAVTASTVILGDDSKSVSGNLSYLQQKLNGSSDDLLTIINSIWNKINTTPGNSLSDDVDSLVSSLSSDTNCSSAVNTINGRLGIDLGSVDQKLQTLQGILGGTSTILGRVSKLQTYAIGISSITGMSSLKFSGASDIFGSVNITADDGVDTYSYSSFPIDNNNTFIFTNSDSSKTISFVNISGSRISNSSSLAAYINSFYPSGTVVTYDIDSNMSNVLKLFGAGDLAMLPFANVLLNNMLGTSPGIETIVDSVRYLYYKISGNRTFSDTLYSKVNSTEAAIDDLTSRLPAGVDSLTISGISIADTDKIQLSFPGMTYISASVSGANQGQPFSFSNVNNPSDSTDVITLVYYGNNVTSKEDVFNYFRGAFPPGSKISKDIGNSLSSVGVMIGVPANSIRTMITLFGAKILLNPTGVINTDFTTARSRIANNVNDNTLEDNINKIGKLIQGSNVTTSLETIVGVGKIDAVGKDIFTVIGGDETTLADRIGDPLLSDKGISQLIGAKNAVFDDNTTAFSTAALAFKNSGNIKDQLSYFIDAVNAKLGTSASSLGDIITTLNGY